MLLIVFAWALVNLDAVLHFLGKVLALFTPFLIGGAIATLTWELLGCPGGYQSALIAAPISILVLVIVSACTQKTLAGEAA